MTSATSWDDLRPRLTTAVVMLVAGIGAIWLGGAWFAALILLCCGGMVWELVRMVNPGKPEQAMAMAVGSTLVLGISVYISVTYAIILILFSAIAAASVIGKYRPLVAGFASLILLAGLELTLLRNASGTLWVLWLVLLVVATDVMGYFGGRIIGGPKLWARVSPKKTWSGAIAGWIGAGIIGACFALISGTGLWLVPVSVLLSMASQAGDIAESALKRRTGVKDSSNLLPGHGGLFDRFDGLLGAALVLLLVSPIAQLPVAGL